MKRKIIYFLLSLLAAFFLILNEVAYAGGPERSWEPWLFYIGGFAGYSNTDYQYGGDLFLANFTSQGIATIVTQPGASGGGQFGFQYHFTGPFSLGMNLSAAINAGKGRVNVFELLIAAIIPRDVNYKYRVSTNVDLTGVFGFDLTPQTHLYIRAGASYAVLRQSFFATPQFSFFAPMALSNHVQHKTLWGYVAGVGLAQDLNRWWRAFVEFDRYDYGNNNLNSVNNAIDRLGDFDLLTQHIRVTASAVRVGFNLKLMDSYLPPIRMAANNPWLFYLGGFGGYSSLIYQYGANYFVNTPSNQTIRFTSPQEGVSGGGQLGLQYHFHSPYFVGVNFSIATDANKARQAIRVLVAPATSNSLKFQFRTAYNVELTSIFGLDILPHTHVYAKLGASVTRLLETFTAIDAFADAPIVLAERREHQYRWGWALGVGLTEDLNRWWSIFAEYDRYDYGNENMNTFSDFFPPGFGGSIELFTQHMRLTTSTVRLGLNLKTGSYVPQAYTMFENYWLVYWGGFVGYYSATSQYEGHYFSTVGNETFTENPFQRGISGGGQLGFQQHFKSPFFVGITASVSSNASKGDLATLNLFTSPAAAPATMIYKFRINPNVDMAFVWGLDILPKTHFYMKLGASYAQLTAALSATPLDIQFQIPAFARLERKTLWGWAAGIGLTLDLNRNLNMFVEYNRDDYGRQELRSFNNLFLGGPDNLTQNIYAAAYSVRLGFNVQLRS